MQRDYGTAYTQKVVRFEKGQSPVEPTALFYGFGIDSATACGSSGSGRQTASSTWGTFNHADGPDASDIVEAARQSKPQCGAAGALQNRRSSARSHCVARTDITSRLRCRGLTDTRLLGGTVISDAALLAGGR